MQIEENSCSLTDNPVPTLACTNQVHRQYPLPSSAQILRKSLFESDISISNVFRWTTCSWGQHAVSTSSSKRQPYELIPGLTRLQRIVAVLIRLKPEAENSAGPDPSYLINYSPLRNLTKTPLILLVGRLKCKYKIA